MKIYSYLETRDTKLEVLFADDTEGEQITYVNFQLVDTRSGKLSSDAAPIEEEVVSLDTDHAGAPRFTNQQTMRGLFINELNMFIHHFDEKIWAEYDALTHDIMGNVQVDIHQFYQTGAAGEVAAIRILRGQPSLHEFIRLGPSRCLERRIASENPVHGSLNLRRSKANGAPVIELNKSSEPNSPASKSLGQSNQGVRDKSSTQVGKEPKSILNKVRIDSPRRASLPLFHLTASPKEDSPTPSERRQSLAIDLENLDLTKAGRLAPAAVTAARSIRFDKEAEKRDRKPQLAAGNLTDIDNIRRPQKAPAYPLPKAETNLFKWIHVPYNHPGWVYNVLTTCSVEANNLDLHSQVLRNHLWMYQHNRSRHASPHARYVKPSAQCLLPQDQDYTDGRTTPTSATTDAQYVVYLPYLHWDSFGLLKKRAKVVSERRNASHIRPTNQEISEGTSMESKLIWQFLTADPPLHCRRTLDQYGYPTLRNTSTRDGDQIMYKRTKADKDILSEPHTRHHLHHPHGSRQASRTPLPQSKDDDAAKVLMVDQLWLWILDKGTVVTFATPKEKEKNDRGLSRQGDLLGELYQNVNGDYADQCHDPFDFAALAVLHAVKALLDSTSDLNLQVFRIFEEYISILTEQQTKSFKDFRNTHTSRDPKESDTKILPRYVDNTEDLDALLELRDIDDELNVIERLFEEQKTIILDMLKHYDTLEGKRVNSHRSANLLDEAKRTVLGYIDQVAIMRKSASTAQSAYKDLLDMKQKQANIVEAHLSREQVDNSQEQARSILIFTIVTIIFLPLSFFASVFGMNARDWSGQADNPTLHTIFTYMVSISVAVTAFALFVGFNRLTRRAAQAAWKYTAAPVRRWYKKKRGILYDNGVTMPDHTASDLEKFAALDAAKEASKNSQRLSQISRTYSKMNWDVEAGPRGSSNA